MNLIATGLKVFGKSAWKARQHGADRRRMWRRLEDETWAITGVR
ncbi:hypothetical protein NT01EI_0977 [Edwardsiella ictaluri 93-146]|uniref:Uncharacterized protein n=1 Tax=Edwardsiella ictaluri (strain 93-146) TaxID=634503 RepID=C5BBF5_EDWI9|nr:hypothetical protein NT01EI_0977 [Edwardsiella ictaluri 93-146]